METIRNRTFDEERALYGARGLTVADCRFDGPADGESAFKEGADLTVTRCFFNLRYPFWHDRNLTIEDCEMTPLCRAALWYCDNVHIGSTRLHGIKALRECKDVRLRGCDILSAEFGWSSRGIEMTGCSAESEYFMLRASALTLRDVRMTGKYSFQYIEDAVFDGCTFDTKDAFWHAKNVTVRNSLVKGEYLAWYSENLALENCRIIGTQPLCYCKNLRLIDCELLDADLCFERSEVNAGITTPVVSIKNPLAGRICVPAVGDIIRDIPGANGEICIKGELAKETEENTCQKTY